MDENSGYDSAVDLFDGESLSVREAAKELRKSPAVIRRYLKADVFANAFKDGPSAYSHWRIPRIDIDAYKARVTGTPLVIEDAAP